MTSINDITHTIMFGDLSNDQLNGIIQAVKFRRSQLGKETKNQLNIGCQVRFVSSRDGQYVLGTVEKINRKTIIVGTTGRGTWRVPANMLEVM
jgi:hypothetical protein